MILLEGTHLLEEAFKTSCLPIEIIATNSWLKSHLNLVEGFSKSIPIKKVTEDVLAAALTTKTPDGVASVFPLKALPLGDQNPNFVLALDRLQDPGNIGTLFRTALAADINMVWLALGADPLSQKAIRSSAGAVLHIPFARFGSSQEEAIKAFSRKLKLACDDGYQVIATLLQNCLEVHDIRPYWEIDWTKPTVLVLGNEGSGIHPLIKSSCNNFITLPHSKAVESLNVASVAVPLLLERRRAKMTSDIKI